MSGGMLEESGDSHVTDAERAFLIMWSIFTLTLCVPGNLLVLISSIKYQAIKLDKITVILMNNVAVGDIGYALFWVLPTIYSIATDKVLLDNFTHGVSCKLLVQARYIFAAVSIFSMVSLNISKLTCLLFPFRSRLRTKRAGYKLVVFLWVLELFARFSSEVTSVVQRGEFMETVYEPLVYGCKYIISNNRTELYEIIFTAVSITVTFGSTFLIFITTVWLIFYVHKVRGIQKESLITLIAVSSVFMLSYLPLVLYFCAQFFGLSLPLWFTKFSNLIPFLNYAANPIIYFLTVKSFGMYVKNNFMRIRDPVAVLVSSAARSVTAGVRRAATSTTNV